jgi:hypothetical protein
MDRPTGSDCEDLRTIYMFKQNIKINVLLIEEYKII